MALILIVLLAISSIAVLLVLLGVILLSVDVLTNRLLILHLLAKNCRRLDIYTFLAWATGVLPDLLVSLLLVLSLGLNLFYVH